ncbi:MAG: hypothetical protein ABL867_07640 [Rickettsiales bacterium]
MKKTCPHPRSYVDYKEKLTRFVYEESHIKGHVSQQVFKQGKDNTLSIYRTNYLSPQHIWDICVKYVDGKRTDGRKSCGRAELSAKSFIDNGLSFEPNGKPHTRHANVLGWNTNKPDDQERRNILALAATGYVRPN